MTARQARKGRERWLLKHGLGFFLLMFLSACTPEPPAVHLSASDKSGGEANILFEGFQMSSTQGNALVWKCDARAAQIYEKANLAKAQDIQINYWQKGKVVSTLTARRGFMNTSTNDMRAEDHVVMVSQEGVVLRTEKLLWDQQTGKISTDLPVVVERQGSTLTGVGMIADSELKHVEILSQVKIKVPSLHAIKPTPRRSRP